MYEVKSFRIEKLWGTKNIEIPLQNPTKVSILIGKNGTGKTTVINLLKAILEVDTKALGETPFEKAIVRLIDTENNRQRTITIWVEMREDSVYDSIFYRISRGKPKEVRHYSDASRRAFMVRRGQMHEGESEVRKLMSGLVNIYSISVYRDMSAELYREPYEDRGERRKNSVDVRLEYLMMQLTRYLLEISDLIAIETEALQKELLKLILFDRTNDSAKRLLDTVKSNFDKNAVAKSLKRIYRELGVRDVDRTIEEHTKKLDQIILRFKKDGTLKFEDVSALPLHSRAMLLAKKSLESQNCKDKIREPVSTFLDMLNKFMSPKVFREDPNYGLCVESITGEMRVSSLSSGEKQLLILLVESLLQRQKQCLFIADEPELSLHVEWQEKLIRSIVKINPAAQVVVATHSPEIAAHHEETIIDMEEVASGAN
ncbi:AAA family ATPase [Pelagicoccus sp. SDUM812002]|uniref:AAA family ATPase n=1 Tax=Pelagicoccus sp. SDUM812002 TaxID=3041266 RepID=UPI00280FB7BB|nr:AAA family ATPase [Pelagicoccus sp. SDUM812002]MDQ8186955.1 AAA family ATPase [Pelagicoccus sp. SDUM812002]